MRLNAVTIHFPVDENLRPIYQEAVTGTVVQQRAKLIADMVDRFMDLADGLGPHPAQTIAYALLSITEPERLELRTDMHFELQAWEPAYEAVGHPEHVSRYARGDKVAPVDGGLFSVDELIDIH